MWAFAKFDVLNDQFMVKSSERLLLQSLSKLPDWNICAVAWSLPRLDKEGNLGNFAHEVRMEVRRRSFTQADVERSATGIQDWAPKT